MFIPSAADTSVKVTILLLNFSDMKFPYKFNFLMHVLVSSAYPLMLYMQFWGTISYQKARFISVQIGIDRFLSFYLSWTAGIQLGKTNKIVNKNFPRRFVWTDRKEFCLYKNKVLRFYFVNPKSRTTCIIPSSTNDDQLIDLWFSSKISGFCFCCSILLFMRWEQGGQFLLCH